MPKKKVSKKTEKPQTSKLRLGLILLIIVGLGYWWFTSAKKTEAPPTPLPTIQETKGKEVTPTLKITGDTYTVKPGDTLRQIALRAYGDENAWVKIAQANGLRRPNYIRAGTVLRIPR